MYQSAGCRNAAGITASMIIGVTLMPANFLQIFGGKWRSSTSNLDHAVSLDMVNEPVESMTSSDITKANKVEGLVQQIERLPSDY